MTGYFCWRNSNLIFQNNRTLKGNINNVYIKMANALELPTLIWACLHLNCHSTYSSLCPSFPLSASVSFEDIRNVFVGPYPACSYPYQTDSYRMRYFDWLVDFRQSSVTFYCAYCNNLFYNFFFYRAAHIFPIVFKSTLCVDHIPTTVFFFNYLNLWWDSLQETQNFQVPIFSKIWRFWPYFMFWIKVF